MRCLLGILLVALFPLLAGAEARFLRPRENQALVRRDLLPLETDTIRALSQHLATLAAVPLSTENAAHNRALAQLLALSLQLNPVNQQARRLLKQHQRGMEPPQFTKEQSSKSQEKVQEIARWLLSPSSGLTGRQLAQLIIDPLRTLHPELPVCQEIKPEGEAARWQNVVPPITAFIIRNQFFAEESKVPGKKEPKRKTTTDSFPTQETEDQPSLPIPQVPTIPLRLSTPLSVIQSAQRLHYQLAELSLTFSPLAPPKVNAEEEDENSSEPSFLFLPAIAGDLSESLNKRILSALLMKWKHFPKNKQATVRVDKLRYQTQNTQTLSGPLALLCHAAFSGTTLRPNLFVVGEIDSNGNFLLPPWGWNYFCEAFPKEAPKGGRILVPRQAEEQLRALLTVQRPEIFVQWEVFTVDNLTEALAHSRTDGLNPAQIEASRLFAEFQDLARTNGLKSLSVDPHVREHLHEILRRCPNHLSAKMMLLGGSNNEPKILAGNTLAVPLQSVLDLINELTLRVNDESLTPEILRSVERQGLGQLAILEKYLEFKNRALFRRFEFTTKRLGQLAQSLKQASSSSLHRNHYREGLYSLRVEHQQLSREVAKLLRP